MGSTLPCFVRLCCAKAAATFLGSDRYRSPNLLGKNVQLCQQLCYPSSSLDWLLLCGRAAQNKAPETCASHQCWITFVDWGSKPVAIVPPTQVGDRRKNLAIRALQPEHWPMLQHKGWVFCAMTFKNPSTSTRFLLI